MDTGIKVAGTGCLHAVLGVGFSFYLQKTKTRMLPMFETDFVATRSSSSSEEKNRVTFRRLVFLCTKQFPFNGFPLFSKRYRLAYHCQNSRTAISLQIACLASNPGLQGLCLQRPEAMVPDHLTKRLIIEMSFK